MVKTSYKKLRLINAYGLLVHNTSYLLDKKIGKELYNSLLKLKKKGKIEKIGISVYSIKELDEILNNYEMDIILAPFNVFDQRILKKNSEFNKKNPFPLENSPIFKPIKEKSNVKISDTKYSLNKYLNKKNPK